MMFILLLPIRRLRRPSVSFCHLETRLLTSQCIPTSPPSYTDLSQTYCEEMKACSSQRSIPVAQKLHAQLISLGLYSSTFLQNHLVHTYSKCGLVDNALRVFREIPFANVFSWNTMINGLADAGLIEDANKMFDEMPERDTVSWNTMISVYFEHGRPEDSVKFFVSMIRENSSLLNLFSLSSGIKACAHLGHVKLASNLHGFVEKFGYARDQIIDSSLMDMYIKCKSLDLAEKLFLRMQSPNLFTWNSMIYCYSKLYSINKAVNLFNQMPEHNTVSWNTIVSVLSQHNNNLTLHMFVEMCKRGFTPNSMTHASVLSVCASVSDLQWGTHLHARILRLNPKIDSYISTGLIDMYVKSGNLEYANRVFTTLTDHNVVSWTCLISGMVKHGLKNEALKLFNRMREINMVPDQYTLATILGICTTSKDLSIGEQLHAYAKKTRFNHFLPIGNALITMYTKCEHLENAKHVFDSMEFKDVISWTEMIITFSRSGNVMKAKEYFHKTPEKNLITWNTMLTSYIQNGFYEEGFKLYVIMQREEIKPDLITIITLISGCASLAVVKLGNQFFAHSKKLGFLSSNSVLTSVVTMYSRCGRIKEAWKVFNSISEKDVISWNTMISGYAQNGQGEKAIEIFDEMVKLGIKPDNITYISVLSGCSHSGLVYQGEKYFNMMINYHGISPMCEHFVCMVDLYARAGLLKKAKNLINEMQIIPNASIWKAFLNGCRIYGDADSAEIAVKNLAWLNVQDSGSYVLMANIYSDLGELKGVSDVRKVMRGKGIQKEPGCSWIEVDNTVHVFTVDDTNHPQITNVYIMLEKIIKQIESTSHYVSDIGSIRAKSFHSEKLAVAFGLISLPPWKPIELMKNLRTCYDCHLVMKLISFVTSREIVMRDANRFHHFKNGFCSCKDYW